MIWDYNAGMARMKKLFYLTILTWLLFVSVEAQEKNRVSPEKNPKGIILQDTVKRDSDADSSIASTPLKSNRDIDSVYNAKSDAINVNNIFNKHMYDLIIGVLGAIIYEGLRRLAKWLMNRLHKKSFRKIFPNEIFQEPIYLVYADFQSVAGVTPQGQVMPYVFTKKNSPGWGFSMQHPISSCEVRAARYIHDIMSKNGAHEDILVSDEDVSGKQDISFISFGGAASNVKTRLLFSKLDSSCGISDNFFDVKIPDSRFPINPGHDYGIIAKIHPNNFPERTWFVCAGRGEWGTSGAAWYLAKKWKELLKTNADSMFILVVSVSVEQDESAVPVWSTRQLSDGTWKS